MTFVRTELTALVREWCFKHQDIPHMTLARMFRTAHPGAFLTNDTARQAIQRERGVRNAKNSNNKNGKKVDNPVPFTSGKSTVQYRYRAPVSKADEHTEFVIHGAQRVLRLSDIHYPFHDVRAMEAVMEYGMRMDPTILLLAGDICDLPDFSAHPKVNQAQFLEDEMLTIASELEQFRLAFPKARIIWMEGNHEQRLKKYVMRKAPELMGMPGMDVPGVVCSFGGPKAMHRVEWVDDCRTVRTGKMSHLHGHEYRGGGGVKPARSLYLKAGQSTTIGHFHKTDDYTKVQLDGTRVECLVTGCLSTLNPDWMRKTEWNHGMSVFHVDSDGGFEAHNHRIIDGKVR
jgi:predicted phosphodiesterase